MPVIIRHPEEKENDIFESTSVELQEIESEKQLQNQYDFLRYGTSDDDMQF